MDSKLYFTPPSDEHFQELKEKAIELWREIDLGGDQHNYAKGKIDHIKDIINAGHNFMYMVEMFDYYSQTLLAKKLSEGTRRAIRDRMLASGISIFLIPFQ
jgi:hypothetical protein